MYIHGYMWSGPKNRFDQEALRRPPYPEPPPAGSKPELIQRYREVAAEIPVSDLPPVETAYWLVKPRSLVRGTWNEVEKAAAWLGERLAECAARFASERDRDITRRAVLADAAAEQLEGADVSLGFYLERPSYLHPALVACSPNRAMPEPDCPVR